MKCRAVASVASLLSLSLVAACGNAQREKVIAPDGLTVEAVYARMERAIDGEDDDDILYAALVLESLDQDVATPVPTPLGWDDTDAEKYAEKVWIDAHRQTARVEIRTRYEGESADRVWRHIVRGDRLLRVDDEGRSGSVSALTCRGSDSPVLAQLMRCGNWLEESITIVESGTRAGRSAIVLVTTGKSPSEDYTLQFEERLYIDPGSYLPFAMEERVWQDEHDSGSFGWRLSKRYEIEFVDRQDLPGDFFEPSAIGHAEPAAAPSENLIAEVKGMRVYWLGDSLDAGLAGPLELQQTFVYPGEFSSGPLVSLSYGIEGDPEGYRGLGIEEYVASHDFEAEQGFTDYWTGARITQTVTTVGGAQAHIYKMSTDYGDLYRAHIYYATSLVVVHDYLGAPPYTGYDAFMRILAALRPFEG